MIHQARPMAAHLPGNGDIRFSINQILSPGSTGYPTEGQNIDYSFPPNFCGVKPTPSGDKYGNCSVQDYFYPKLENYFSERWGNNAENRHQNSSLYFHDYRGGYFQNNLRGGGEQLDVDGKSKQNQNGKNNSNFAPQEYSPEINRVSLDLTSPTSLGNSPNFYSDYNELHQTRSRNRSVGDHNPPSNSSEQSYSKHSDYPGLSKSYRECFTGYAPTPSFLKHGPTDFHEEKDSPRADISSNSPLQTFPDQSLTSVNGANVLFAAQRPRPLHHSPMMSGNFPWMESRRERIACKYCDVRIRCI